MSDDDGGSDDDDDDDDGGDGGDVGGSDAATLADGHSVFPLSFREISFFRCLISEVAWPIVTKLCHMFDGDSDL